MTTSEAARGDAPTSVDPARSGYSEQEIVRIYSVARLFLGAGDVRRAERVLAGLVEVEPGYVPAWLGLAYVHVQSGRYDDALTASRAAARSDPSSQEAIIFLAACTMAADDFPTAGACLGEVREKIDAGTVQEPKLMRLYQALLARYQSRV